MPNWCYNDIELKGAPKMLDKLLRQIKNTNADEDSAFDFDKVIPIPKGVDWYEWCISNWGTKWNASDVSFNGQDELDDEWESGEVQMQFSTAWSPPIPVMQELSKQNPKVKITHKFTEEGNSFYGTYIYRKGEIEVVSQGDFNSETPCEIYEEYYGDSYHHHCKECDENFECEGEPKDVCPQCEASILETDKELWEDTNETETKEAPSIA